MALAAALCLLGGACSQSSVQLSGGSSSETVIGGALVTADYVPARNTQVIVLPADYNPISGSQDAVAIDTTDQNGNYRVGINRPFAASYSIQAVQLVTGERKLIAGITIDTLKDTTIVPQALLTAPSFIKIISDSIDDTANGYYYLPGTMLTSIAHYGFSFIDSVPTGSIVSVHYGSRRTGAQRSVRDAIKVTPGDTEVIRKTSWRFARQLYLNTTASGAGVSNNVTGFPVLIRLSAANFNFDQAKRNGEDVRFTKSDGTDLPYEIEEWNSGNSQAEIWVHADTVFGNDTTHGFMMYWGNASAVSVSSSPAVFDTNGGFQGVWHLSEPGNTTAFDATANHYDGTPLSMTAASGVTGMIGAAQQFDGLSSCIQMAGTANSKLNFPENGHYSISAWVYTDVVDSNNHMVAGKGHEQYYLKLRAQGSARWEFVEFHNQVGWEVTEDSVTASAKTWKYIEGVRDGAQQYFYLDGALISSTIRISTDSVVFRNTADDASIGRFMRFVTIQTTEGFCYFKGTIDEVRICSAVHNADWIRLCYMNQKMDDKLVLFK